MSLVDRFDRWVERGPFTPDDLGIYRIVYAVSALLIAPDIAWLGRYPDFMFHAPPGPLRLLSGFPSPTVLIVLEVLRTAALVLLGVGLWTRWASLATWLMLTVTYGLTYCLGKVDHTILLTLVPLILAFANWGDRFSMDARRRGGLARPQPQWPLRLLALLIGWAFFAAAMTKILTGWLSFHSQAARGYFVLGFLTEGRTHWLAGWIATHDVRAVWEVMDWATVAFELSILVALPSWRALRIALAVAAAFHLGVLLVMNIDFSHAVVAYGAFVSWGAIAPRIGRIGRVPAWLLAVAVAAGAWFLMVRPVGATPEGTVAGNLIIVVGAAAGVAYLARRAVLTLRGARRARG